MFGYLNAGLIINVVLIMLLRMHFMKCYCGNLNITVVMEENMNAKLILKIILSSQNLCVYKVNSFILLINPNISSYRQIQSNERLS